MPVCLYFVRGNPRAKEWQRHLAAERFDVTRTSKDDVRQLYATMAERGFQVATFQVFTEARQALARRKEAARRSRARRARLAAKQERTRGVSQDG